MLSPLRLSVVCL